LLDETKFYSAVFQGFVWSVHGLTSIMRGHHHDIWKRTIGSRIFCKINAKNYI